MLDYLKIHADTVRLVLHPGERALALLSVQYIAGEELVGPQHDFVDFDIVSGLTISKWERSVDRSLLGTTLRAKPGDAALGLVAALQQGLPVVILTTGRLLLVEDFQSDKARVVWEVPITLIGAILYVPKWNQRGRIGIVFRDRSWVRLNAGFIFARKAKHLVAQWEKVARGEPSAY